MMGGLGAHEYMAPCPAGENDVALSSSGYAANVEVASATPQPVDGLPSRATRPSPSTRRARRRSSSVAGMLGVPAGRPDQGVPGDRRGARPGARR